MKNAGNILLLLGLLTLIYSIIGRFVAAPTIILGLIKTKAIYGVILANSIMLIGISLKLWDK